MLFMLFVPCVLFMLFVFLLGCVFVLFMLFVRVKSFRKKNEEVQNCSDDFIYITTHSPYSHLHSPHFHTDSPHSFHSHFQFPHSISRFPIPAFTDCGMFYMLYANITNVARNYYILHTSIKVLLLHFPTFISCLFVYLLLS